MTGKLKWFDNNKGYGFIMGDDGNDYFIHITKIENGEYSYDDIITFDTVESRKGKEAVNAKLA